MKPKQAPELVDQISNPQEQCFHDVKAEDVFSKPWLSMNKDGSGNSQSEPSSEMLFDKSHFAIIRKRRQTSFTNRRTLEQTQGDDNA